MFSPATLMFLGAIILLALLHGYSGSKGTEFLTGKSHVMTRWGQTLEQCTLYFKLKPFLTGFD